MPITSVQKDPAALTMTVVAEFSAPVDRLWDAYSDPRQIERFWGPPSWPATFLRHDVRTGGRSAYLMTGPDGETSGGFWEFLAVDPGRSFEVRDGFTLDDGQENTAMPSMRIAFAFEATASGSRLTTTTYFPSAEALTQLLEMGMEQGMTEAMSQIDGVLADLASFAAARATEAQILSDTKVRISRIIAGSPERVWAAYHEPDLMRQWLLGPDGWTMPVCDIAVRVGDRYRFEWERADGTAARFGFDGELLESALGSREVTTEHMIDTDYPETINELTFTPIGGRTLLSLVITYPSAEVRDMVLATGMVGGMETSYQRLESQLAA
jgi:uncharacterized protein YndB with AHSA1/START domain